MAGSCQRVPFNPRGEALITEEHVRIDLLVALAMANPIRSVHEQGVQPGMVIGGRSAGRKGLGRAATLRAREPDVNGLPLTRNKVVGVSSADPSRRPIRSGQPPGSARTGPADHGWDGHSRDGSPWLSHPDP